ncbi:MAG: FtsH protease activity modulator HflK [Legionellaceae bacterium]|nr:FtsH protease activity modulator HflK [Legionellaceae bacterium]
MGLEDPNSNKQRWNGSDQQPPDLEAMLKAALKKMKALFLAPKKPIVVETSTPSGDNDADDPNMSWLFVVFVAVIVFLWAVSGIFIVDPAEKAVVLRFGKYIKTVGPGPHWIPRLICSKVVQNVDRVSDYSYSAQMLTKDENLVSVSLAVQYRIGDLKAYLFNVSDAQESLQQATSSALRQVVGQTTLDQIITEGREAWGRDVDTSLTKILERYKTGLVIVNVSPQPARAPENVQEAFDDAIKAQEDEKRFKEQAYAYEARVLPIAEGNAKRIFQEAKAYAEQAVLLAKAEVAEYAALLPQYLKAPDIIAERMYLETMQQILSKTSKVIVDTKANNMLYLPLDKATTFKSESAANASSVTASKAESAAHESDWNGTWFDGRPTARLTTRPTEE